MKPSLSIAITFKRLQANAIVAREDTWAAIRCRTADLTSSLANLASSVAVSLVQARTILVNKGLSKFRRSA